MRTSGSTLDYRQRSSGVTGQVGAPLSFFISQGTDGPATSQTYSGGFLSGLTFTTLKGGLWFKGWGFWVCDDGEQPVIPQKFALWNLYKSGTATLLVSTTSGDLTPGWNQVNLDPADWVALAPGGEYIACTGVNGNFPYTANQFGATEPYADGLTQGLLFAWSNQGASAAPNYDQPQGSFSTADDPTVSYPTTDSDSANFWVDVLVSTTPPPGYSGSYRMWPNVGDVYQTNLDSALNFTLATEFELSAECTVNNVWFYSPPGVAELPTEAGVWSIDTGELVLDNQVPAWSGAAASGWVSADMGSPTLPPGKYKVSVYDGNAVPQVFNGTVENFWTTGYGANGYSAGPLSMPNEANATSPGQSTYNQGPPNDYPDTYAGDGFVYWVDIEVTPT